MHASESISVASGYRNVNVVVAGVLADLAQVGSLAGMASESGAATCAVGVRVA